MIRQCVIYLLIVLLPLQATAASRMASCAEMKNPDHAATTIMTEHCAQLAAAAGKAGNPVDSHQQPKQTGCWLGSICLATLAVAAIPANDLPGPTKPQTAIFPALTELYRSVVLDDPQRPPTAL
jgi:hypothetical protein